MLSGTGTILIADDESYLRESLRELFAAQGYTVLEAADGTEVMRLLRDSSVDTILLDLKMPKLDGISTLKALKKARAAADSGGDCHRFRRQRANHRRHESRG